MKGFGCTLPGKEVGWIEKAKPIAGPFDAVVRPLVIAPCSSDVHNAYEIGSPKFLQDRILGHEAIAEVVEVGSEVKDFKVGDRIVVPAVTPNWRHPVIQDSVHQHTDMLMDSFKYAFSLDGVFAEYFLVPDVDMNAALLPDGMPLEKAIFAVDMMSTGFHGVELADVQFGESVAVLGVGPVGLMAVAGCSLRGAGKIYVVDTNSKPARIEVAKEYGASEIIDYMEGDTVAQLRKLTNKKGVDKVIIAGGDSNSISNAIKMVRPGGIVSNINFYTGVETLPIPLVAWGSGMGHKTIKGGLCPGGRRRMERMLAVVSRDYIDLTKMVTHTFRGLEYVEDAFYLMANKPADLIKPLVFCD